MTVAIPRKTATDRSIWSPRPMPRSPPLTIMPSAVGGDSQVRIAPGVDRAAIHPSPVPDTTPSPTTTTAAITPVAAQARIRCHHPAFTPAQIADERKRHQGDRFDRDRHRDHQGTRDGTVLHGQQQTDHDTGGHQGVVARRPRNA